MMTIDKWIICLGTEQMDYMFGDRTRVGKHVF